MKGIGFDIMIEGQDANTIIIKRHGQTIAYISGEEEEWQPPTIQIVGYEMKAIEESGTIIFVANKDIEDKTKYKERYKNMDLTFAQEITLGHKKSKHLK